METFEPSTTSGQAASLTEGQADGVTKPASPLTPGAGAQSVRGSQEAERLLEQAEEALSSAEMSLQREGHGPSPLMLPELATEGAAGDKCSIDLFGDVELDLRIELGRTELTLEELLRLRRGSVVPLDKLAGDPVDIWVNGRLVARGEVLVMNDNFCVRVLELVGAPDVAATD
jgi:flagellar motor switch protein FliN/FliY